MPSMSTKKKKFFPNAIPCVKSSVMLQRCRSLALNCGDNKSYGTEPQCQSLIVTTVERRTLSPPRYHGTFNAGYGVIKELLFGICSR